MEASDEILLNSLANSGVPIPLGCSSVRDLTPPSLFSLCSAALRLIDGQRYASAFPPCLPEDSIPDRLKITARNSHTPLPYLNELGYSPNLSFHKVSTASLPYLFSLQFLYPSEEDSYNLVRFFGAKLSESSGARTAPLKMEVKEDVVGQGELGDGGDTVQIERILDGFNSALHNVKLEDKETNAKEIGIRVYQKGLRAPEAMTKKILR
ncbi:hypothetical protein SASPL_130455 [Salvia splendens]|uniref:CCDC22 N-terminal domain-containing protein n=1 Tax=Salvia splendens TaxID=180675 RepID=A0A8X8X796_SALSN|nr:hypothetical protein SASPL_130455 [Salvia splendens]